MSKENKFPFYFCLKQLKLKRLINQKLIKITPKRQIVNGLKKFNISFTTSNYIVSP